jgi:hypothetical protein
MNPYSQAGRAPYLRREDGDAARTARDARREDVLACWRMQTSAGFLKPLHCRCGHHRPSSVSSSVRGKTAWSWVFVNPREVER